MKTSHVSDLRRNVPRERVDIEIEISELSEIGNLPRDRSGEAVVVQVEPGEAPELGQRRRELAGETLSLQRYVGHFVVLVARQALERPVARVSVLSPRAQNPALRVQRGLDLHQSLELGVAMDNALTWKKDQEHESHHRQVNTTGHLESFVFFEFGERYNWIKVCVCVCFGFAVLSSHLNGFFLWFGLRVLTILMILC